MVSTSSYVALFEDTPRREVFDMRVDSGNGPNAEEDSDKVDDEKGDGVKIPRNFSDEDAENDAEYPKKSKKLAVVLKEIVLLDEGLGLSECRLNVFHHQITINILKRYFDFNHYFHCLKCLKMIFLLNFV